MGYITAKREAICYSEALIVIRQPVNCSMAEDRMIKTKNLDFGRKTLHYF